MIIAWLPKEKILFEADMLDITYPDHIGQGGGNSRPAVRFEASVKAS